MIRKFFIFLTIVSVGLLTPARSALSQSSQVIQWTRGNFEVSVSAPSKDEAHVSLKLGSGFIRSTFTVDDPSRVVVDVSGVKVPSQKTLKAAVPGLVSAVRIGLHEEMIRIVIDCKGAIPPAFKVHGTTGDVTIVLRSPVKGADDSLASAQPGVSGAPEIEPEQMEPLAVTPTAAFMDPESWTAQPSSARESGSSSSIGLEDIFERSPTPRPPGPLVATATPAAAPTVAPTLTATPSPTKTRVATKTPLATRTAIPTKTPAATRTPAPTKTPKHMATPTAMPSPSPTEVNEGKAGAAPVLPSPSRAATAEAGPELKSIRFDLENGDKVPTIRIELSQRAEFKMSKIDDRTFEIILSGYQVRAEHLLLAHYPTDEFMGFSYVRASAHDDGLRLVIGVDRGVRISAVPRDHEIWIRAQQ